MVQKKTTSDRSVLISFKVHSFLFSEAVHIGWKQFQDFVIKVGLKDLRICEVWCLVRTFFKKHKVV